MAQKIQTFFMDDLDGSDAEGTVSFALDGIAYEIDLSKKNADELSAALAPYIQYARAMTAAPRKRAARGGRRPSGIDTKAIRAWAGRNGIALHSRGRIPARVVEQYQNAR